MIYFLTIWLRFQFGNLLQLGFGSLSRPVKNNKYHICEQNEGRCTVRLYGPRDVHIRYELRIGMMESQKFNRSTRRTESSSMIRKVKTFFCVQVARRRGLALGTRQTASVFGTRSVAFLFSTMTESERSSRHCK